MKLFNKHKTAIILLTLILILSFLSSLKNDNLIEDSKEEISNTEVKDKKKEPEEKVVKSRKLSYDESWVEAVRKKDWGNENTQTKEKVEKPKKPTTTKTTTPVSGGGSDEIKVTGVTSGRLVAKKTKRNYILKRSSVQLNIDWPKDSKKSKHLFYKVSINNKYVTSLSDYNFNESFKANIGDVVRIDRKTQRSFNSYEFCTSFVILENKYQYLITCK